MISLGLIIGIPILIDATSLILESKGISVGAWFRKKLGLPPKKAKSPKESEKTDEEGAPVKQASGSNPQGKPKSSSSNQRPKGSSGKKGKGSH